MLCTLPSGPRLRSLAESLEIEEFIRPLRGGSQSRLVRCNDGKLYVLKMNGNPQGPNLLANELLGSHLLRGLGLSAPLAVPVYIDQHTIDANGLSFEMPTGFKRLAQGWQLALELASDEENSLFEWISPSHRERFSNVKELLAIYAFDVWASHRDWRQCVFEYRRDLRCYKAWFIDNGHLFGGPDWSELNEGPRGATSPYIGAPYTDSFELHQWTTHFRKHLPRLLREGMEMIPTEWYKSDIAAMVSVLSNRLQNLSRLIREDIRHHNLVKDRLPNGNPPKVPCSCALQE